MEKGPFYNGLFKKEVVVQPEWQVRPDTDLNEYPIHGYANKTDGIDVNSPEYKELYENWDGESPLYPGDKF